MNVIIQSINDYNFDTSVFYLTTKKTQTTELKQVKIKHPYYFLKKTWFFISIFS